jgi:hypothetical protein
VDHFADPESVAPHGCLLSQVLSMAGQAFAAAAAAAGTRGTAHGSTMTAERPAHTGVRPRLALPRMKSGHNHSRVLAQR